MEDDITEIADFIKSRLRQGLAGEVHLTYRGNVMRIIFVPSFLYSFDPAQAQELVICCENKGAHFWNGLNPLTRWDLISSGFPLRIAESVEALVLAMFPVRVRHRMSAANAALTLPDGN